MNKQVAFATLIALLLLCNFCQAQTIGTDDIAALKKITPDGQQIFNVNKPDYTTSPYTGMGRQHWKDAALYLLDGAFSYIKKTDDPMKFPKQEGKSYPRDAGMVPTEKLEGLCRTLFIAAPLLKETPSLVIRGIKVADYYRYQISKLVDSTSVSFIKPRPQNGGTNQNLVEFGALSVALFAIPEIIWDPMPQNKKDALAATMLSYGDGPTVPSNWKFFNTFILSFYKSKGYPVNEKLLEEYLEKITQDYRGEGWYNDNPAYDYYSMWAFQMYGTIWSEYFGKKYYPKYAAKFLSNFKEVKNNYPYMFSRDGEMIMWGRSISYRIGATIPFPLMGMVQDTATNYGWMRRIASGVMLQFLQNPALIKNNIPTLGFYGPFEPAVQSYSCRGSVFWMGKAFLGLLVPADNPYWLAKENEGPWLDTFSANKVYNKFIKPTAILMTDYPNIGAAEIRAWCHVPMIGAGEGYRGTENYNRLSYNSAFPWQADGQAGEVAMNYVFKNKEAKWEPLRLYTFKKFEDGVYYRDAELETNKNINLQLAEITLPNGILRVDKNTSTDTAQVRIGHYALPKLKDSIIQKCTYVKGHKVCIIDNGKYQLGMVALSGWDKLEILDTKGLNPVSDSSKIINATATFTKDAHNLVYATLMLWKKSGEAWTDKELCPISKLSYSEKDKAVTVLFSNGEKKVVKY
ncbi:DUF2264 domain-containing protein [Parasediminibacterium sp. JCM 36343]|uniref:DUF2264 domain-containing protein n=1 Tax=Parasediminibacterium sp. JCM 36343 TaxID=3374279 RepID=UPI00397A96F3